MSQHLSLVDSTPFIGQQKFPLLTQGHLLRNKIGNSIDSCPQRERIGLEKRCSRGDLVAACRD
jgi:hypothetical protein